MGERPCTIEITGNWRNGKDFLSHIQTREPWIEQDMPTRFFQTLVLPSGKNSLRLEYDPFLDKCPGFSIADQYESFTGLKVDDRALPVRFSRRVGDNTRYDALLEFEVSGHSTQVRLELDLLNTRVMRTWISSTGDIPNSMVFQAVEPEGTCECLVAHGIPFLARKTDNRFYGANFESLVDSEDRGSLVEWESGFEVDCMDAHVKTAHFLGMIHGVDIGNGSWYSRKGDEGFSHFVGDKAGEILLKFTDGETKAVPLIFGFNLWFGRPWDMNWHYSPYINENTGYNLDDRLFSGQDSCRDIIQKGVMLVDGVRCMGSDSSNARYIFSLDLEGRAIHSMTFSGVDGLHGFPLISGITLETDHCGTGIRNLPAICTDQMMMNPVDLAYIDRLGYSIGVERIMKLFYTFQNELPTDPHPRIPEGYFGPAYDFQDNQEAVAAASFLYRNGPENAAYIADSGTECRSSTANEALHHYTLGMGVWIEWPSLYGSIQNWFRLYQDRAPGMLPGRNEAWTRGAGELIRESMAFGYDKFISSYIDWLDGCLMREANPPHWNRMAGRPEACTYSVLVGETEERGNRENDGHGICMWGRYLAWHWFGRPKKWNREHWEATKASVEWIQWQLDTDQLRPGVRKDALYSESECAYGTYEIYSSYNCLHGLKLAIRMAEQLSMQIEVERWEVLYQRLRKGIADHLVDVSEDGPVWHTCPETDWQDHAHSLVHIQLATDGDTYTPIQEYSSGDDLDRLYLEISMNTYHHLMKSRNYNCLRMFGYGQGMMAQAALLLDEMEDAGRFLQSLLRHCYLPRLSGWACPEGIIVHPTGDYYLPVNGYRGQDSHLADATKALRLMLGIDDNNPGHLRIIPRYPAEWNQNSIAEYPVLTDGRRQKMKYIQQRNKGQFTFDYGFEHPVERLSVRLGPFPDAIHQCVVLFNRVTIDSEIEPSGDSHWVWIRDILGTRSGAIEIRFH